MNPPQSSSAGRREVRFEREPARRVFAAELREARHQFREGTEEKSPTYVLLPTGQRCNRVFVVGSMTEKQRQGEQNIFYRARIVDPTGTTFVTAGNYQPEAMQQISQIEPPAFVAVVGKPNVFEAPDGGGVYVSLRAESVTVVDRETRDLWVLDAAKATLDRIDAYGTTEDSRRAAGEYRIEPALFRKTVADALAQLNL
ncbi:MAG TPA: nucleic acid-binding protein [Methanoregulaceae archaeon]|nr:nucleic acid-binding protein [Methanoregulaceae archaeon]HQJ88059.1 nucleic acid-binding protein [Methanoregulaceae archaeon]